VAFLGGFLRFGSIGGIFVKIEKITVLFASFDNRNGFCALARLEIEVGHYIPLPENFNKSPNTYGNYVKNPVNENDFNIFGAFLRAGF
jgi:hypothetical protein